MALQLLAGNIMPALIFADYASQFNLFNTCLAPDLNLWKRLFLSKSFHFPHLNPHWLCDF